MASGFRTLADTELASARAQFTEESRTRLYDIWAPAVLEQTVAEISGAASYASTYHLDGHTYLSPPEELARLDQAAQQRLADQIYAHAGRGVGFLYERYFLPDNAKLPQSFANVAQALNSEPVLRTVREITGLADIASASIQVTRYQPGHFLTRHNDIVPAEQRLVAYVLGFTRQWHPDWGGLLQFYTNAGTPQDAWVPGFNDLMLFDVHRVHAVTFVTPFAQAPRFAISGWFSAAARKV
jgi:SM-20-related protein